VYFTSLLFSQTWQVKKKVEGITYLAFLQKSKKKHEKVQKVNTGFSWCSDITDMWLTDGLKESEKDVEWNQYLLNTNANDPSSPPFSS